MPSRLATVQAKFILSIVPVVVVVALLFSGIFGYHDYSNAHQALKSKQENLPKVYSVALAALSQNFQDAWIARVIASLALDPDVADAAVFDDEEKQLARIEVVRLEPGEKRTVVDQLIVDDTKSGRLTIKGKIRVGFHERALNQTITERALRSVGLVSLLAFAIVLVAVVANRLIIGRPLERFLHASRTRRIHLVLHDTDPLTRRCPRMMALLGRFSHAIQVNRTHEEIREIQDSFLVLDAQHYVRRPVAAFFRGAMGLGDETEGLAMRGRFMEIWAASFPAVSSTTVGL